MFAKYNKAQAVLGILLCPNCWEAEIEKIIKVEFL